MRRTLNNASEKMGSMKIFELFDFDAEIQVMDVGAAAIAGTPIYKVLLDKEMAHLTAFDGDERQIKKLKEMYGEDYVTIYNNFLFDGEKHQAYLCSPASGMSSILKPKIESLNFFNGFNEFGKVESIEETQTTRLDDIDSLNSPDFLKMDVQGAELGILKNGSQILKNCLAMQLEVSYFPLYEDQPSFGEVDVYMRTIGFVPHCFLDVKRWSIAPTIFNNNFRVPGNQLLESDVVYVKNPLKLAELNDIQLQKLAILAHYSFKSFDYCIFLILEMERRNMLIAGSHKIYIEKSSEFS
jgi:FkbM family methyltransferase